MNTELLITFIILNIVNVIIQTAKSIATIKCGKFSAAAVNAVAYGLYTVVVVYTVCDLPLWLKVVVVALCNLIGVFVVKLIEEKSRKDKLWKVEATIPTCDTETVDYLLNLHYVPHSFVKLSEKHTVFYCYCATQLVSSTAKKILDEYNAKYFVSESKTLI
mgnify:FL=1